MDKYYAITDGQGRATSFYMGRYQLIDWVPPAHAIEITADEHAQWSSNQTLALVGGVLIPFVPPVTAANLAAYAANKRWQIETGGCSDGNGNIINTDRDSQSKMVAEMVAMGAGLRIDPSPWKMRTSFVSLSNAQMMSVIGRARAHVTHAFAIEASTAVMTSVDQIDAAAWPASSQ